MVHLGRRTTFKVHSVFALTVTLAVLNVTGAFHLPVVHAIASYNCIKHCAAHQYWPGNNYGTFTDLSTAQLICDGSACYQQNQQAGFIANAQWTYDTNGHSGACADEATGYADTCWIETGYSTYNSGDYSTEEYYWADNRPGTSCLPGSCSGSYAEHTEGTVPSSDYGVYHFYNISRTTSDHSKWSVYGPTWNQYSVANSINPNLIYMGSELLGPNYNTSGAYGGYADWTNNEWVDSSSNYHYQGAGLSGAGLYYVNGAAPPYIHYVSAPNGSANNGGDIQSWCCEPGGPGYTPAKGPQYVPSTGQAAKSSSGPSWLTTSQGPLSITPHITSADPSVPAFTQADVVHYVSTHSVFRAITSGVPSATSVRFMSSKAASDEFKGEPIGLPDTSLVSVVEVHGSFTFISPLTSGTAHQIFEVFDAHTGNLLMVTVIS